MTRLSILPWYEGLRPGKVLKFYVYKEETPDVPVGSEVIFIGGKFVMHRRQELRPLPSIDELSR